MVVDDQHLWPLAIYCVGSCLWRSLGCAGAWRVCRGGPQDEIDCEGRARTGFAGDFDVALHELRQATHDRQAQTGAPKRRVVELSACTKGWNRLAHSAGLSPMPVSP